MYRHYINGLRDGLVLVNEDRVAVVLFERQAEEFDAPFHVQFVGHDGLRCDPPRPSWHVVRGGSGPLRFRVNYEDAFLPPGARKGPQAKVSVEAGHEWLIRPCFFHESAERGRR